MTRNLPNSYFGNSHFPNLLRNHLCWRKWGFSKTCVAPPFYNLTLVSASYDTTFSASESLAADWFIRLSTSSIWRARLPNISLNWRVLVSMALTICSLDGDVGRSGDIAIASWRSRRSWLPLRLREERSRSIPERSKANGLRLMLSLLLSTDSTSGAEEQEGFFDGAEGGDNTGVLSWLLTKPKSCAKIKSLKKMKTVSILDKFYFAKRVLGRINYFKCFSLRKKNFKGTGSN